MSSRALEALDRILNRGGEPDDVLRAVVAVLAHEPGVTWAGIAFLEEGSHVLGPEAGTRSDAEPVRVPVVYQGSDVGELWIEGVADRAFLERVAVLVSAYVLIGWDTRGQAWDA